ncbi:MAG: septal ring lytic transglycosylase RlpA family protein [Pseudomonadota bacterium]
MPVSRRRLALAHRCARLAPLAALIALTLPSGSAAAPSRSANPDTSTGTSTSTSTSTSTRPGEEPAPLPDPAQEPARSPFAAAFAALPAPSPIIGPAPGAVDLTLVEPPRGPLILRTLGTRTASYYGKRFHGRLTANGERFDMNAMTAAHKTLPFGTRVLVTNPANGRSVTVRINDRGPFIPGRTIDLSRAAAQAIGMIRKGHARVRLDILAR